MEDEIYFGAVARPRHMFSAGKSAIFCGAKRLLRNPRQLKNVVGKRSLTRDRGKIFVAVHVLEFKSARCYVELPDCDG